MGPFELRPDASGEARFVLRFSGCASNPGQRGTEAVPRFHLLVVLWKLSLDSRAKPSRSRSPVECVLWGRHPPSWVACGRVSRARRSCVAHGLVPHALCCADEQNYGCKAPRMREDVLWSPPAGPLAPLFESGSSACLWWIRMVDPQTDSPVDTHKNVSGCPERCGWRERRAGRAGAAYRTAHT